MRKKLVLTMLLLLSVVAPFAALADSFTISTENLDVDADSKATISFSLDSSQDYYGFQADVILPEGLTAEEVTLNAERTAGGVFEVVLGSGKDGALRIAAFSTNKTPIKPGKGELVDLKVILDSFTGGDVKVSNVIFTKDGNVDEPLADSNATLGIAVTKVSFKRENLPLKVGDKTTLTPVFLPDYATDKSVTWSSKDTAIATVDDAGNVTAVAEGETVITVTSSNGKTATISVNVSTDFIKVESVTISYEALELIEGEAIVLKVEETGKLTASVYPEGATDKGVTWLSSNNSIVTVDADGNVTALNVGTAVITAVTSNNDVTATCTVTVSPILAESVTLNEKTAELEVKETVKLSATVLPDNTSDKTVTWTSSNDAVATVVDGIVTANAIGEATITAKSVNGNTDTCVVTVVKTPVTSVSLGEDTALSLTEGENATLTATVAPENATDKDVTWTTSDESVATVDNGVVTAVKAGTAYITATADGKSATRTVTVAAKVIAVTGVTLVPETLSLTEGENATLTATVAPENATDKDVTWTTSDESIATVENGVVTAVKAGTAYITATADGKSATCPVTVVAPAPETGSTVVPVKMTYVNMNDADNAYGEIPAGKTAMSGFNKISGNTVGFGNTDWGVNYITYLQVNVSEIEGTILNTTLSFEASEGSEGKRTQTYGVGYNSSVWSSDMTYDTADKSITLMGATQDGTEKYADRFKTFSFDITEAVLNTENGLATIIIYETVAAGGYIKNPVVTVEWTKAPTYQVTFKETNGAAATVVVKNRDVTAGTSLIDGTYDFSATAKGYKDYSGTFTVAGADKEVEFSMTPKDTWHWTLVSNLGTIIAADTCYEGESATAAFPRYILTEEGALWEKYPGKNTPYTITVIPETNNYEAKLNYTETKITDGIFYVEGEDIEGMEKGTEGQASSRNSNAAGGYASSPVTACILQPGTYKMEVACSGNAGATFNIKLGEDAEKPLLACATKGYWESSTSDEFVVAEETKVIVECEGSTKAKTLDYILITGKVAVPATSITLDKNKINVLIGKSETLVPTVAPDNTTQSVVWTSDNEEVATVADGVVTAHKAGNATITATCGTQSATCDVKCYPRLGDATMDGVVNITDAVDITNYVVGKKTVDDPDFEFYKTAADANKDDNITFADASAAVTILLQENVTDESAKSRIRAAYDDSMDALVIGNISATADGKLSVPVTLDYSTPYVALQADIILPAGVNVEVKENGRVAGTHILATNKFADNRIRVALYNFGNDAFVGSNAPIFEIVTDSNISNAEEIVIVNIIASDSDANGYMLRSDYLGVSAVEAIGFESDAPVKVYDLNGRYVADKVEGLAKGIYVIRQGENAKKVNIR